MNEVWNYYEIFNILGTHSSPGILHLGHGDSNGS